MVIDKIQNSEQYQNLHPGFKKAFDFIHVTDFSEMEDGKYEIEGDNIFAIVQEYDTRNKEYAKLEGHRKFIDIQYIHSGEELIGIAPLRKQAVISDNPENDIAFYEGDPSFIKIEEKMFTIFFPQDLHMPGIKVNKLKKVCKVVVKIKV